MSRAKQFGVLWTDQEKRILRKAFKKGGIEAAQEALPRRGKAGVARMTYILKLTRLARRWTDEEKNRLRRMWGFATLDEIGVSLNRPLRSICYQAVQMGLKTGAPPGWELIGEAARRYGIDNITMKRILIWDDVEMVRAYTPSRRWRSQRRIAQTIDIDEAVARYASTEAIETAAKRLRMPRIKLIAILRQYGVEERRSPASKRSHRRMLRSDVDAAVKAYRDHMSPRVSLTKAAKYIGVARCTLRRWLIKHGVQKSHRRELLFRRDVDRVVAAEVSRGDKRLTLGTKKPGPLKLAASDVAA